MGKTKMYSIEDKTCFVRDLGVLDDQFFRYHERTSCPICLLDFKVGDKYTLIASNFTLFPNIGVHTECFNEEESIKYIIQDYRNFKAMSNKFRHWM